MSRRWQGIDRALVAAIASLLLALAGASVTVAYRIPVGQCMAGNETTLETYGPDPGEALMNALAEASDNDTIWVRGRCQGNWEIHDKIITLRGYKTRDYPRAVLDANVDRLGSWGRVLGIFDSRVTLRNLRIVNGRAEGTSPFYFAFGGGILADHSRVTLVNSVVANNTVVGHVAFGGGIANAAGHLTIAGSTISGNRVQGSHLISAAEWGVEVWGGGIASSNSSTDFSTADASLDIWRSSIIDNVAEIETGRSDDEGALGGGVASARESLRVAESEIRGNRAVIGQGSGGDASGGGLWSSCDESVDIATATIADNVPDNVQQGC